MADPSDHNQAEPADISAALDVELLDVNLYRSNRNLALPFRARGVFGGQVISQALVAATKCVRPEYALHSLHAYFLLSASAATPLLYYVDRVRDGRSYSTRSVRAVQGGRAVFIMLCSFHTPEFWQPSRHWPMPPVPPPEECISEVVFIKHRAEHPTQTELGKSWLIGYAEERMKSPISVKHAGERVDEGEGRRTFMYWMKAETSQRYPAHFQKCILAYITDLHFMGAAITTSGLKRHAAEGAKALGMSSSLDHSLVFYNNDFDCGDWLLYVMTSPASALGRGFCSGLLYSRDGTLLAATNQEGVLRANVRPSGEENSQVKAKI
ncbi:thioesterase-like superfamily-domain-containing protein [Gloeopeniophorella convolvens]|nr:thioesterase-like superfamily-domain-containing protein [Gloeopeniophorella convolvens]